MHTHTHTHIPVCSPGSSAGTSSVSVFFFRFSTFTALPLICSTLSALALLAEAILAEGTVAVAEDFVFLFLVGEVWIVMDVEVCVVSGEGCDCGGAGTS